MADVRAVVYLRQSQDRAGDELGISRQREDCRRLCSDRGWTVEYEVVDNDTSASTRKPRPGYQRMLDLVDTKAIDVVVVWHIDRLVRRLADLEDVIERCQAANVRVATVSGDLDLSTDAGRLVGRILASVARGEVERKSARQKAAQAQAAQQGRRVGGRRPFGFDADGLTVRPAEAAAIRDGYASVLAGVSLAGVARDWNGRGLGPGQRTRDGRPSTWRNDSVRHVLLNPRYAGLRAHREEVVGKAVWPAIVPEHTYRAVERELTGDHRRRGGVQSAAGLLTGVALCGVCKTTVHLGRSKRGQRIYRCRASYGHVSRQAEVAEDYVGKVVVERLSRKDAYELLRAPERPDTAALRDEAQALRSRLESIAVEFADGDLTPTQIRAASERIRAKLADIERQMADAGRVDVLGPLLAENDVAGVWNGLADDRKRAIIDTLMTIVLLPPGRGTRTFRPETVEIAWRS